MTCVWPILAIHVHEHPVASHVRVLVEPAEVSGLTVESEDLRDHIPRCMFASRWQNKSMCAQAELAHIVRGQTSKIHHPRCHATRAHTGSISYLDRRYRKGLRMRARHTILGRHASCPNAPSIRPRRSKPAALPSFSLQAPAPKPRNAGSAVR